MTTIQKEKSLTYTFFIQGKYEETEKSFTIDKDSFGFVSSSNGKIYSYGLTSEKEISSQREYTFKIKNKDSCEINNKTYYNKTFIWIEDLDCFFKINADQTGTLSMMKNCDVFVDKTLHIKFKDIKIVQESVYKNMKIKTSRQDDIDYIYLNGEKLSNKEIIFNEYFSPTEHFYIKFTNNEYSDIKLDSFPLTSMKPFCVEKTFKGRFYPHMNFKSTLLGDFQIDNTISEKKLIIRRSDKTEHEILFKFIFLDKQALNAVSLKYDIYHSLQRVVLDYDKLFGIKKISGSNVFSDPVTKITCTTNDGTEFDSFVTLNLLPTKSEDTKVIRLNDDEKYTFKSDKFYIINRTFVESSLGTKDVTLAECTSYSSFSEKTMTWSNFELKRKISFDKDYVYNIFAKKNTEIDLTDFGSYNFDDRFKFSANGKSLSKSKYKLNLSKEYTQGSLIERVKFEATLIEEVVTKTANEKTKEPEIYSFEVDFVYEEYARTSFIVEGDENFGNSYFKTSSFFGNSFIKYWTYGSFKIGQEKQISSYGNKISEKSEKTNLFPIVSFEESQKAIIKNTSGLEMIISVFEDDYEYVYNKESKYTKLNSCSGVNYENSKITVSKASGLSFFSLGDKLFLLRSVMSKSVSFMKNPDNIPKEKHVDTVIPNDKPVIQNDKPAVIIPSVTSVIQNDKPAVVIPNDNIVKIIRVEKKIDTPQINGIRVEKLSNPTNAVKTNKIDVIQAVGKNRIVKGIPNVVQAVTIPKKILKRVMYP